MCNRYGYQAPVTRLIDEFSEAGLPLRFIDGFIPNLEPRAHIRPTNDAPILRPIDAADPSLGLELVEIRWWLIPFFHKHGIKDWKAMCTNARAETVAKTPTFREPFKRRRCLVPATCYYEWNGKPGSKTMWRFTRADDEVFCFAGLWDRADTTDGELQSFTILTCAAGPVAARYHNRQPVIVPRDRWGEWLDLSADVSSLIVPDDNAALLVEAA